MADDLGSEYSRKAAEWLISDEWQIVPISRPGWMWGLGATDSRGRKVVVGQRPDRADQIIVHGTISLENPADERIAALSQTDRMLILQWVQFELIRCGLDSTGIQFPTDQIEIAQRVFLENLSKPAFLSLVSKVRNGLILVMGKLEQENWT